MDHILVRFWSHFYLLLFAGTFSSSLFLHFRVHYSLQLRCRVHFPTQRFHIFVYVLTDSCIFRHIFFTFFHIFSHFFTFLRGKQRARAAPPPLTPPPFSHFFHIFVTFFHIFFTFFLTFLRGKQRRGGRASPAQARQAPQAPQPQASPGPQDPPRPPQAPSMALRHVAIKSNSNLRFTKDSEGILKDCRF